MFPRFASAKSQEEVPPESLAKERGRLRPRVAAGLDRADEAVRAPFTHS